MAEIDDRWHATHRSTGARVRTDRYGVGRRWLARWRDPAGVQRKRAFDRRVDADRFLVEVAADLARGGYVDPRGGRITFRTYAEQWRCAQVHRATTAAQVESHLRRHVYPTFGDRPLGSIRPSEVQAGSAASSRTSPQPLFRSSTRSWPASSGLRSGTGSSPSPHASTSGCPSRSQSGSSRWPPNEVEALIAAMPERYQALVVLAAGTGLRQGEAFGLEVGGVDFLRRTLEVRQQLVTMPGKPPYLAPPKTPSSYRTVPLPQVVVDALAAHLAAFPTVPVEILDATHKPEPKSRQAALVFTTPAGVPVRRTRFSPIWRPAATAAGLGDGVTFHDLRHYYASLLIRHGESVKAVQRRLGHKSAVETLDTYSHLWPDSEDRTREAVDAVLGRAAGAPRRRPE